MPNCYRTASFISFLLAFSCLHPTEVTAQPADVRFEDEVIPSGTYEATTSVTARNATVQSTSQVTFRAGQTVRLEAGFKAELGATLQAEVDPDVGSGGGLMLSNLPPHLPNSRFEYEDVFKDEIVRPGLSVRGFDAERFADGGDLGLGLKQVLEKLDDNDGQSRLALDAFDLTLSYARDSMFNFAAQLPRGEIERNTRVLQARAFVALVTYVLEQNGVNIQQLNTATGLNLPPHDAALAAFREPWTAASGAIHFRVNRYADSDNVDVMKWARSLMMLARAVERSRLT